MYVTTARLQYSNKAYICMVTKISIFTQPLSNLLFAHWEKPFVHANTDHEIITMHIHILLLAFVEKMSWMYECKHNTVEQSRSQLPVFWKPFPLSRNHLYEIPLESVITLCFTYQFWKMTSLLQVTSFPYHKDDGHSNILFMNQENVWNTAGSWLSLF